MRSSRLAKDVPVDPAPVAEVGRGKARSLRVLVIDDNARSAEYLARIVTLWGHDTRVAHDGPSALDAVGSYRPEVILLDIGLPGMDGYAVARRLRQIPGFEKVLMVAITGYSCDEDRRRSSDAGFDHHLVKPLDLDVLKALLISSGTD